MLDVVDGQMHLFRLMGIDECLAAMDALGISSVLIDEAWGYDPPNPMMPSIVLANGAVRTLVAGARMAAMQHPDRFRYLLRVDHRDPALDAVMALMADDPHCVAFRSMCDPNFKDDLAAGRFDPVFRGAANLGRPLFIQTIGQSASLAPSFEDFPDCRFVVDHAGLVQSREGWEELLALSRYPNVAVKWCHAELAFPSPSFPFEPMQLALKEIVDAFGADRIMWASDAGMRNKFSWADALYSVRICSLLTEDERAWVLGRTARTILGWPAPILEEIS